MIEPRSSDLLAAKRVIRYIKGTLEYGILFQQTYRSKNIKPVTHCRYQVI